MEQLRLQLSYKFGMGSAIDKKKNRQVVEILLAHLHHRYRRLADCWEKLFITKVAFMHYWLKQLT